MVGGLEPTGTVTEETLRLMSAPRCGVRDNFHGSSATNFSDHHVRSKRYIMQGSKWKVKDLTYRITKYPSMLSKADVDKEVSIALQAWGDVSGLTFQKKNSGKVNIEIRFVRLDHGDGDPFDGPGGVLAHAFFPMYGGDAHFDSDESFTVNSYSGTNLLQVAAHEFGHSLGLAHSKVSNSLMAPFYKGYDPNFALHSDDIKGIQALYGKPGSSQRTASGSGESGGQEEGSGPSGDLCNNESINTMFTSAEGTVYVFKGDKYWLLTGSGVAKGYPRPITDQWEELPSDLDAAFTWSNGRTYFFKGSIYWRYSNQQLEKGYPKKISSGFSGIPDSLDAATPSFANGVIYFFKGSQYWRFSTKSRRRSAVQKSLSTWRGLPNNVDAAILYNQNAYYFFKGGNYWRVSEAESGVDDDDPAFPRPAGNWWFGCQTQNTAGLQMVPQVTSVSHDNCDKFDAVNLDEGNSY
nr:stromelysin-3-like [Procambarus clarkii]